MEQLFQGQVALVTGGGKGIGLGIAQALAKRGARVALTGRHQATLDNAVESLHGRGTSFIMDVRDPASVEAGVRATIAWGGRLDILVNNAGIGLLRTPLSDTTLEAWRDVIDTNLTGSFVVTKAAWPHLTASKGQVMNVSSISGTQGFPGASAYCASKFGLSGFTEVLKREGAELGVRALALCPGPIATDIWGDWATEEEVARMITIDQLGEIAVAMLGAPRNIDLSSLVVTNAVSPWST
ncbi:MAG: SDR family NAD(P)-dependent oxidoreductase [Armatimonadetes bacterium]|nr:SDR family NAD(P)-dependent oxidoreductase [Armatimonadota bacterium]